MPRLPLVLVGKVLYVHGVHLLPCTLGPRLGASLSTLQWHCFGRPRSLHCSVALSVASDKFGNLSVAHILYASFFLAWYQKGLIPSLWFLLFDILAGLMLEVHV